MERLSLGKLQYHGSCPHGFVLIIPIRTALIDHNRLQDGFVQLSALSLSYVSMRKLHCTQLPVSTKTKFLICICIYHSKAMQH